MKFDPYKFNQLTAHGVPVYYKNIPWANGFVYIKLLIKVGSRFDPIGKEGLAHFLEHLPFNGSSIHTSYGAINRFDRTVLSDTLNARTSYQGTMFEAKTSTHRLERAMSFLSDLVFRPLLKTESVELERKVITQEFWSKFTNHRQVELSRMVLDSLYPNYVFSRVGTSLGWDTSIQAITREDLVQFHCDYYNLGNVQLLIVGDVDESSAQRAAKILSDNAPQGKGVPLVKNEFFWPNPVRQEISLSAEDFFGLAGSSKLGHTSMQIIRAMPVPQNEKIVTIAGDVTNQLLRRRIRHKLGATYTPRVSFHRRPDVSSFEIELKVAPETEQVIREIVSGVISEIAEGNRAHASLFSEMRTVYVENKTHSDVTAEDIADEAADELAVLGRIVTATEEIALAEATTYEDAASLFQKEMSPPQLLWYVLRP